jgi:hypothetical protein
MTGFMHVVSFIGSAGFYLPVLLVVFWCVNPRAGAWAAVVLSLGGALNTMLKIVVHAPRPFWTDPGITGHEPRASFGMPSGHAQGSAVAWGLAGMAARRTAVWAAVVVVVALVGVSRVYLGVHSIGQVVAGWLIGAVLLLAAHRLTPIVVPWWRRRRLSIQLGLSMAVAAAFLVPTAVAVMDLADWRMPIAWARAIKAAGGDAGPVTPADGVVVTGTLFGVLTGASWLAHRGWFDATGTFWRRLARLPAGMAGVGVIWFLGSLADDAVIAVFVTYALLALWVTAGAPEVFVRLRLAERPARGAGPAPHEPGPSSPAARLR